MATISIGHRPELTSEQALETFQRHFTARYQVYATKMRLRDFIVKKSDWAGVGVRLKQETGKTTFVFSALMPNVLFQALFGGLPSYLFLRSSWKALEADVAQCIESEFATAPKAKRRAA